MAAKRKESNHGRRGRDVIGKYACRPKRLNEMILKTPQALRLVGMRIFGLLISLLGAACLAADAPPAGVDALSPDDVAKAVAALKSGFVRPEALSDSEMARATLQGLLDRLAPAAGLITSTTAPKPAPFYSEIYNGTTGYLRLGELTGDNVSKARGALKGWSAQGVAAVVLDLRGTPASSDFDAGADFERLFCAKGTEMFSLNAGKGRSLPGADSTGAESFSATADPPFKGILVVLVDSETAEAPEAVAASLQQCAKALVVGDRTAGKAFEFSDVPLGGAVLRIAIAQVILPDGKAPGEMGLTPDIAAGLGAPKAEVMASITAKGIESVTEERDRPHLNEAALVSGSNPEVDEIEAEQSGKTPAAPLIDRQLEQALDMVTSISIFQAKGQ